MTDVTIKLEDLKEAYEKHKNVYSNPSPTEKYIKSITPKPGRERPALIKVIAEGLETGKKLASNETIDFIKQINTLRIMESLWKKFGEGHEFVSGKDNYFPVSDACSNGAEWANSIEWDYYQDYKIPCTYYYSKEVPEVLKILTKLKVEGVI